MSICREAAHTLSATSLHMDIEWRQVTIPPFHWATCFQSSLFFHLCLFLRAFGWCRTTYEASPAGVLWTPCSAGWWGGRGRDIKTLQQQTVYEWSSHPWPGLRETDSRWCSWNDPQCSKLHGRTPAHSSPHGWLSCWSCWWTPRKGRHTGKAWPKIILKVNHNLKAKAPQR